MRNIFDKLNDVFSTTTVKKVFYSKTTLFGQDGKVVKETRVLNDGGDAETPEEVKRAEAEMEKQMKKMDRFFDKMTEAFKEL